MFCYRKGARINTNMRLERFHRELKYKYLKGKTVKCVDKGIKAIFELVHDKQYERNIKLQKGKVSYSVAQVPKQHKRELDRIDQCRQITDDMWQVPSLCHEGVEYTVTLICNHAHTSHCVTECRQCGCCNSSATCTCEDNAMHGLTCRHIHAVCTKTAPESVPRVSHYKPADVDVLEELAFHEQDLKQQC